MVEAACERKVASSYGLLDAAMPLSLPARGEIEGTRVAAVLYRRKIFLPCSDARPTVEGASAAGRVSFAAGVSVIREDEAFRLASPLIYRLSPITVYPYF